MPESAANEWLSTEHAARRLGVTARTLYALIDKGELPAYKMGRVIRLRAHEVDAYIDRHADERDEHGRRLVVRNGHAEARRVTTAAGAIEIQAPRVNDKGATPQ